MKRREGVDCGHPVSGGQRDDQLAMSDRQHARRHNQANVRGAREGRDGALDLAGVAHADRAHLHPERRRHRLDRGELANPGGYGSITKDRRSHHTRRDLFEQFQPFPAQAKFELGKPVALPPGRARLATKPAPTGSGTTTNTIGTVRVACSNGATVELPFARMTSGASAINSAAYLRMLVGVASRPAGVDPHVAAAVQPNCRSPCRNAARRACASGLSWPSHEDADAPHRSRLLRACGERPRSGRTAAEQRDELAPSHSITSSARASSIGGTSKPSAFAVLRLITSSYLVGACTGRSAGFATSKDAIERSRWRLARSACGTRAKSSAPLRHLGAGGMTA